MRVRDHHARTVDSSPTASDRDVTFSYKILDMEKGDHP